MPVVGDALQFETRLTQLRLLCEEAGRPDIGIHACTWEIDEKLNGALRRARSGTPCPLRADRG